MSFWKLKGLDLNFFPRCKNPTPLLIGEIRKQRLAEFYHFSKNYLIHVKMFKHA
jgi:hypothetical protein